MTQLSSRFSAAVEYARVAHDGQTRKGTRIPYLYHLLGVASLVLEHGGDEHQAIAGLLHDVVEDCGAEHAERIRVQFGDTVARIVADCTDGSAESKQSAVTAEDRRADWLQRKRSYLAHLAQVDDCSLLVSGCDKLHNARAILADLEGDAGLAVFERFTGGMEGSLAYYASIAELLAQRSAPMHAALERVVDRLHALAGQERCGLASFRSDAV